LEKLKELLDRLLDQLEHAEEIRSAFDGLISVYPFNEFEYIISHILSAGKLTIEEYYDIRDDYIHRNLYLYLFEISAPRGFGEVWAHGHLKELVPTLQRPSKLLDPAYSGQYDFFLHPGVRIEVKASRAVEFNSNEPLYIKALSSDSSKPFDMNFQQIKPRFCDVFVWLAAWRDVIRYWVIPSYEVENNRHYSRGQHRGNVGEGQLHLNRDNIHEFDMYLTKPNELEDAILSAYERERELRRDS
jgi:hypothetical protein